MQSSSLTEDLPSAACGDEELGAEGCDAGAFSERDWNVWEGGFELLCEE